MKKHKRPAPIAASGAVTCTWWEYTGRMTEFVNGVSSPILRQMATGEELSSRNLPAGALWVLPDDPDVYPKGADRLSIACKLPDGHTWFIDSQASNCTKKDDLVHRCWVRHGTVGEKLTVDKHGDTCKAGGGSIKTDTYHGFLRNGELVLS